MKEPFSAYEVIIASDVSAGRDGIGVEIYKDKECLMEIFRDDTKKSREITLYKKDISLELVEEAIAEFKREIPWKFQDEV
jgi:hypothetical protein